MSADLLAPLTGACPGLEDRLRPFVAAGVLAPVDVHTVDRLGRAAGEDDPDVLLAAALALAVPRAGHVRIDLSAVTDANVLPESPDPKPGLPQPEPLPWPANRKKWLTRLGKSPLVCGTGPKGGGAAFVLRGSALYAHRYATYEDNLAKALAARADQVLEVPNPALLKKGLSKLFPIGKPLPKGKVDRQALAAAVAALRGLTVISGGPGTGKTTTVRAILALFWAQRGAEQALSPDQMELRVALAAPTGKAATRMSESLRKGLEPFVKRTAPTLAKGQDSEGLRAFLTGIRPSTLHRLLGFQSRSPTRFRHGPKHPLPYDVVVVDETSMVDLPLMSKLLDAVAPDTRLIFLGDQHQLASVGAGTVLADVCGPAQGKTLSVSASFAKQVKSTAGFDLSSHKAANGVVPLSDCIVLLEHNHRFGETSGIGKLARAILKTTDDPKPAIATLHPPGPKVDAALLEHGPRGELPRTVRTQIVAGYRPYLERLLNGPNKGEDLATFHAAVLDLFDGFRILSAHRRGRLGAAGLNLAVQRLLRSAVPAFQPTEEGYYLGQPILVRRNDYVVRRFNGDVGLVVLDANGRHTVAFPAEGGGVTYLAPVRLPEHQTVFAMTIHKSQGSEFDDVLVVLPNRASPVLTRELVYTGVTRAKERVTVLSPKDLLGAALTRRVQRASGLADALWGEGRLRRL